MRLQTSIIYIQFSMNSKKFFLIWAGLLAVIIFAGCQAKVALPSQPAPVTKQVEGVQPDSDYSAADQIASTAALDLLDPSFCEKITVVEKKSLCLTQVEDKKILVEAKQKMDSSLCNKISAEDARKACAIELDYLKEQKKQEENFQTGINVENKIISGGDVAACKTILDENVRAGCEYNILINQGQTRKEGKAICSKASAQEIKTRCFEYYDSLPETVAESVSANQ